MKRIDAIEVLLKTVSGRGEWQDAAALSAVAAIVYCEEDKLTAAMVKKLVKLADDEQIDSWMDEHNIRVADHKDGVPANRVLASLQAPHAAMKAQSTPTNKGKTMRSDKIAIAGNISVSLTKDAYDYNNVYFTLEVTERDGAGSDVENDAEHSGLKITTPDIEVATYLGAALASAVRQFEETHTVRRTASNAAQEGMDAVKSLGGPQNTSLGM